MTLKFSANKLPMKHIWVIPHSFLELCPLNFDLAINQLIEISNDSTCLDIQQDKGRDNSAVGKH